MTDLLLFTRTVDAFRHTDAIEAGVTVLTRLAAQAGLSCLHTEDADELVAELAGARGVVFHQCNGEVLDGEQRTKLLAAVEAGCGFAGVHNSTGALRSWPQYLDLIGARFATHPMINDLPKELKSVCDDSSTEALPRRWLWSDEWYEFEAAPVGVEPLLVLADEPERALSWRGRCGLGATWYTALGHRGEAYSDEVFLAHLWGGITSVLG